MVDSKLLAKTLFHLSHEEDAEQKVDNFFSYLEEKKLTHLLPSIQKQVLKLQEEKEAFNTLFIHSKDTLTDTQVEQIKAIAHAPAGVTIVTEQSDDVLGSFRAQYQGTLYDGSLREELIQMKRALHV